MDMKKLPVAAIGVGALLCGLSGGVARAETAAPSGYITQMSCTGMSGSVSYTPGLTNASRAQTAVLTATLTGCADGLGHSYADAGTFSAQLSGTGSTASQQLTGTFTSNWPPSSGYNPTVGTVGVRASNGAATLGGFTSTTTGAWRGSVLSSAYTVNRSSGKRQTFVNTMPLLVRHNIG